MGDNQDSRGGRSEDREVQCEVIIDTNISFLALCLFQYVRYV